MDFSSVGSGSAHGRRSDADADAGHSDGDVDVVADLELALLQRLRVVDAALPRTGAAELARTVGRRTQVRVH